MKAKFILAMVGAIVLLFTSCSEDGFTNSLSDSNETGQLRVRLTDAPFPFDLVAEANVTVFKVEARRLSAEDESNQMENETEGASPFVLLMESEIDVNLLELTNGTTTMLADLEVPQGSYDMVRIFVKGINVVLTDGRVFDLKVPSGEQSGIKIFIKPALTVAGGLSSDLLLDFDVSRSFVAKGSTKRVDGIKGFNFKPVIKASNLSTSGTLQGNISTLENEMLIGLEGAQVSIFAADTLNTTALSDVNGNYLVMGLEAGSYDIFAERDGFIGSDSLNVQIVSANSTTQDFILEIDENSETEEEEEDN